jgi:hydroxyacyl-ACP dehydratase HTD2-like protein with hotdog domain
MKLDPITVFRYSALTFNSHMIHFSTAYAKDVEHHPELIIQAPLNLTLLLNFWRDNNAVASENITLDGRRAPQIKKLVYEVKTPVYVGEGYSLKLEQTSRRNYSTRVEKDGTVAMAILITTISEGTKL